MDMIVTIYGKKDCKHCAEFKEKMDKMSVPYSFVALDEFDGTEAWRTNGAIDALATSAWYADILPIIRLNDRFMTPFEAERRIKRSSPADRDGKINEK